jgi:hypothetical protein
MRPTILYTETAIKFHDGGISSRSRSLEYVESPFVHVSVTAFAQDVTILEYIVRPEDGPSVLEGRDLLSAYIDGSAAIRKGVGLFDSLMAEHGPGLFGAEAFAAWNETAHVVFTAVPVTG